ncbi:hypothetical protein [Flindersiella endophytica]
MTSPPSPAPPRGYTRSRTFLAIVVMVVFVTVAALAAIFFLADVITSIGHLSQGVRTWWEDLT